MYKQWAPWIWTTDRYMKIKEPPCRCCKYFGPKLLSLPPDIIKEESLCHASDMFKDYSCYDPRPRTK
jgi:hypothetical protein